MKLGITGSRTLDSYELFENFLKTRIKPRIDVIVHGCCKKGADKFAADFADNNNKKQMKFPAQWDDLEMRPDRKEQLVIKTNQYGQYNASAGFERNHDIVINSDVIVAFWDGKSRGTKHTFNLSINNYNKPTILVRFDKDTNEIIGVDVYNLENSGDVLIEE